MTTTTTPTTAELTTSIVLQLEANLEQTIPLMPKIFLRVLAKVLAAAVMVAYKFGAFAGLQKFARTASFDEISINGQTISPLREIAYEHGIDEPRDAVRAELLIDVTVLRQTGYLREGVQLLRKDSGIIYSVVAARSLDAATVDVRVRATSQQGGGDGSGEIGNLSIGDELEFSNPLANVATVATVASTAVFGVEAETEADYRARVQEYLRLAQQGGAYADYRIWAESANGVANAYPFTGAPGEMIVYIEALSIVDADGVPTAAVLAAAEQAIRFDADGFARRVPANLRKLTVLPIYRATYDAIITGLVADDLSAAQDELFAAVDEYMRSRQPWLEGLSYGSRLDRITQGEVAGVVHEICTASNWTVDSIQLLDHGSSVQTRGLAPYGSLAKLGTITWA